jgi:MoxR-like ATPase
LSKVINVDFKRVQFTPDLLPADLLGTMIYNQKKEEFISKKGPLFSTLFWQMKLTELLQKFKVLY